MNLEELIIAAVVVGSIGTAILLTKFELLAEVVALILKAILKSIWMIFTACFEIIKSILEICVKVFLRIFEIFFPSKSEKPESPLENKENI